MFEIHQIARDKWRERNARFKTPPDIPAVIVPAPNVLARTLATLRKTLSGMRTTAAPPRVSETRQSATTRE